VIEFIIALGKITLENYNSKNCSKRVVDEVYLGRVAFRKVDLQQFDCKAYKNSYKNSRHINSTRGSLLGIYQPKREKKATSLKNFLWPGPIRTIKI
jgi:hypothetical protein